MDPNEIRANIEYVRAMLRALDAEIGDGVPTEDQQARWDEGVEYIRHEDVKLERHRQLETIATIATHPTPAGNAEPDVIEANQSRDVPNVNLNRAVEADFDTLVRGRMEPGEVRDAALVALERAGREYGTPTDGLEHAERLARRGESFARHIATYGQPVYAAAWAKRMTGRDYAMTADEARALVVGTATSAGNVVPTHLDPSIIMTNAGAQNPMRAISRVVTLPSPGPNTWNGVTSAGVTAAWAAEGAAAADGSPATVASAIPTIRAQAHVRASYEAIEDVSGLQSEVLTMFGDAKNRLEAAGYVTGTGSTQPTGITVALDANTFVEVSNTTAATLGLVDLHAALNGLSARFRDQSTWLMSPQILGTIQQLGTAVSASFSTDITQNYTGQLLGRPVALSSSAPGTPSSTTQVENWLAIGDFGQFVIVDKIGMSTIYYPVAVDSDGLPTGHGGWYTHWRTGSEPTYSGDATTTRAFVLLQDITSA